MLQRFVLGLFCVSVVCANTAHGQVFSNSRQSLSHRNRAVNSGLSTGRRWSSNNSFRNRSPDWTLRSPRSSYRNAHVHQSASNGFTSGLPLRRYSSVPNYRVTYGNYGGYGLKYGYSVPHYSRQSFYYTAPYVYQSHVGFPVQYGFGFGLPLAATPHDAPAVNLGLAIPQNVDLIPQAVAGKIDVRQPIEAEPVPLEFGEPLSAPLPADETPVNHEFGPAIPVVIPVEELATVDRIRSLRYQASGDSKFRRGEFADALALYQQASKVAPTRVAPHLRQVWVFIAEEKFEQAVVQLKTALQIPVGNTSVWISARQLYGPGQTELIQRNDKRLWDWLQRRPNSTDRLLIVSAWQMLREYNDSASELLTTARALGLDFVSMNRLQNFAAAMPEKDVQPK